MIRYDHRKKTRDVAEFMEELPTQLRNELGLVIHKKLYKSVEFLQGKETAFQAWAATVMKPLNYEEMEYIYKEGEVFKEVYFISKGVAAYVLPR